MTIGVVSDTHSKDLPRQMLDAFRGVDAIIHAGDFCLTEDLEALGTDKEIHAVQGNMDDEEIRRRFPRERIITVEGRRIGIFHGEGAPPAVLESVKRVFRGKEVDAVVFGHSHVPFNETLDDVLYFNPGSPTDTIFAPFRSFGLLTVTKDKLEGRIVRIRE